MPLYSFQAKSEFQAWGFICTDWELWEAICNRFVTIFMMMDDGCIMMMHHDDGCIIDDGCIMLIPEAW